MNPGLAQILTIVHTTDVTEIEHVLCNESVDVSCHHSVDTWVEVGFGRSVEDPAVPGMLEKYTRVFEDAVRLMADCFDLELDEVRFEAELGACTKDVDLGWYHLAEGTLGGCYLKYIGVVGGRAADRDAPRVADDAAHRSRTGTSRAATSRRSTAIRGSRAST